MQTLGKIFVVLIVVAVIGGGIFLKLRYDGHMAADAKARADIDDVKAQLDRTSKERDDEKTARASTDKQSADTQADLTATKAELEQLRTQRAEAEERLTAMKMMTSRLQKMIDTGKLTVLIRNGRMIVKLPAEVLFASGEADLSAPGQAAITEVATVLKEFKDRKFMVAGHTDNLAVAPGKYKDNWELSTARALTVTQFLIRTGMPPRNLAAAGYGEYDAVANNGSPQGRQENRRIELVLLPTTDELPPIASTKPAAAAPSTVPAASSR
jgi:chemotaxis protein MotB